jgi:hypothetical protein
MSEGEAGDETTGSLGTVLRGSAPKFRLGVKIVVAGASARHLAAPRPPFRRGTETRRTRWVARLLGEWQAGAVAWRIQRRVYATLALLGAALIAAGGYQAWSTRQFVASSAEAIGTVVALESSGGRKPTYRPLVRFRTAGGVEVVFREGVGSNPPSFAAGERVRVLYDPGDPARARVGAFTTLWIVAALLAGAGAVVSLFGASPLLARWTAARRGLTLRRTGMAVEARLEGAEKDHRSSAYGQTPWRIAGQWVDPATGKLHVFVSEHVWFDPRPHLRGETIRVWVDRRDPRRYSVDLEFLPKLAG